MLPDAFVNAAVIALARLSIDAMAARPIRTRSNPYSVKS